MMIGGFAELATIGAVVPFLSLLAQPESLSRFPALATILDWLAASTAPTSCMHTRRSRC